MASSHKPLNCSDYHVAWICAVADLELLPARLMLDDEQPTPPYDTHYDENTYICGTINGHAVVVATCPQGETGNVNAGRLTGPLFKTFPNIRMAVLVGIGGGIPRADVSEDTLENLHLGDVVVGWPGDGKPACVYHDRGKAKANGQFELVGTMQSPDWRLTNALGILATDYEMGKTKFDDQLARLQKSKKKKSFTHPGVEHDRLYKAAYRHVGEYRSKCTACDEGELVQRPKRTKDDQNTLIFHQGRIATGNAVIQDGELRDEIGVRCNGALCVEMEAAGVDVNRRCLVIRGISDYADSHKNDVYRTYAAGTAAAFARELLCRIPPGTVKAMEGEVKAPWLVPFPRPQSFVGRDAQLAQLSAHISSEGSQRLALYGLGGSGKTALTLEAVYRAQEQQPKLAIFWVPAVSQESFEIAYREIGMLLRIPGILEAKADIKRLVKKKLSDEDFGRWLLVVDNADDVSVLMDCLEDGSSTDRLLDYLPHSRRGSILFTTRALGIAVKLAENNVIELGDLNREEATEVLKTRLFQRHRHQLEHMDTVNELLHILAFLALAIVQAVAFINTNDISLSEYIKLFKASDIEASQLLSKDFEDQGRYREVKNPVATTWYISFEQIRKHHQRAADHLSFMACTANNNIPLSLLPMEGSQVELFEAIGTLKAYAFITERRPQRERQQGVNEQTQRAFKAFDVHPLVHLAIRSWLKARAEWLLWATKVLMRLVEVIPFGDYDTREAWTGYLPHATLIMDCPELYDDENRVSLLEQIGFCEMTLGRYKLMESAYQQVFERNKISLGSEHPDTLVTMNNLAQALSNQGKYREAEKLYRQILAVREKVLGRENPATLGIMNNLATVLNHQGKYETAETMHRESLTNMHKILGMKHPDTLANMNNLALVLSNQGKFEEAEKVYRETLEVKERVLRKDDPDKLASMSNLATTLSGQGKYEEAEKLYRETLAMRNKISEKDHPHTLSILNGIASMLCSQGKYGEAETMYRETLAVQEEVLGKDHPDALLSMNDLAAVLDRQGKYDKAELMYRKALAARKVVLGNEHPKTLSSMNGLATMLCNQGKYEEAETMYRETLTAQEKVLGKDHPDTLSSMNDLALILNNRGKYKEAETLYRETITERERVLGKKHPSTLTSRNNLANVLRDRGEYEKAEEMFRETLALRDNISGKEHPDTISTVNNLALALSDQGKHEEADTMYRAALRTRERSLGKEHPHTLLGMNNLAQGLCNQGKYKEAETMYRETLEVQERVLGKDHPNTLTSMSNLAVVLSNQGKHEEAEKLCRETLAIRGKVSGKEHPHTLVAMNNLALALSNQEKYEEAIAMYRKTMEIQEMVLGEDHPDTLTSMSNLAADLINQEKHEEAEKLCRETLAIRGKVSGKEHPHTLVAMNNLALALSKLGKFDEAKAIYSEILEIDEKVLKRDHPGMLTSMNNLAAIFYDQAKYEEAETMLREILEIQERVLGRNHPDTLLSIGNLEATLRGHGKYEEAEKLINRNRQ